MATITLKDLTLKLQFAPTSVLEKIWDYAESLLDENTESFTLSDEQKKHLLKQNNIPLDDCDDAEKVFEKLKEKYEL